MRRAAMSLSWCSAALLVAVGCSGDKGKGEESKDVPAEMVADVAADVAVFDAVEEVSPEVEWDVPLLPDDGKLRVGVAVRETPAPVGIPTAGYGETYDKDLPHSQFTQAFAATTKQHTPMLVKAVYFQRHQSEFMVLRVDKIGTTPEILDETTRRLDKATGRKWNGKLILACNHTHLGPGRLWENVVGQFANDEFWPHYYDLYVDSLVDAALAALADAEIATVGHGKTECPECHNDRRCENKPILDSTMWVVKILREDGSLKAVILDFAIHGTVFGWADLVLSGDAPGMIEQKLQETFDAPVEVIMLQSWGGDVSPADPEMEPVLPENTTIPGKYSRLERIGLAAANHVQEVLPGIETTGEVELDSITLRLPMYSEIMGYEEEEWPDWLAETGALLCGTNQPTHCWGEPGPDPYMLGCIPIPEENSVRQVTMSALRIGDLLFFTLPGEPHTDLAVDAAAEVAEATGFKDVIVIGYAQDHWGYLMKEYDWLLAGYEPTITIWGPHQGDFIAAYAPHVAGKMLDDAHKLPYKPLGYLPKVPLGDVAYKPMDSTTEIQVLEQPAATIGETDAAVFKWAGGDPWFGTPLVVLEKQDGEEWTAYLQHDGRVLDNRSYLMESALVLIPSWNDDEESTTRQFVWTVTMPTRRNVPTPTALTPGTYRFSVSGTVQVAGKSAPAELLSDPFTIE